jgi:hypothetical protein
MRDPVWVITTVEYDWGLTIGGTVGGGICHMYFLCG